MYKFASSYALADFVLALIQEFGIQEGNQHDETAAAVEELAASDKWRDELASDDEARS